MPPCCSSSLRASNSARSGMFRVSERGVDAVAHAFPLVAQVLEPSAALRRDGVVDALAAIDALALGLQRAGLLETVQDGVDHAFAEADRFGGHEPDGLDDLVAVHLAIREHSQNE